MILTDDTIEAAIPRLDGALHLDMQSVTRCPSDNTQVVRSLDETGPRPGEQQGIPVYVEHTQRLLPLCPYKVGLVESNLGDLIYTKYGLYHFTRPCRCVMVWSLNPGWFYFNPTPVALREATLVGPRHQTPDTRHQTLGTREEHSYTWYQYTHWQ
ncbi:hypothetical protein ElyMa_003118700 [Elysia marginata]|uniref:Uncharacterized protein n=1 Tax=Elysia marginata TaxID=1093978 RepID=A0AAV4IQ73_9GAST|nr:hypothetical protein ElyMa_003118700 [Elysia marginata]